MQQVKTKLLFAATSADETAVTTDAIMDGDYAFLKARSRRVHRVKTKLFAATAAEKTMAAIDAIVDDDAVIKARGQRGVMRDVKGKLIKN